ncbi:MAG TPA: rhodanese-like domain-containing protein [Chloroflexia bacterium]|nr:rhodanese-like domain-containing protein [Chloroflexia bacterium]
MIVRKKSLKRIALFAMLLAPALLLGACGGTQQPPAQSGAAGSGEVGAVVDTGSGRYRDITPAELKAMMDGAEDFFHVDVHVPNEGKLPELDARIPFDQITQQIGQLPQDKSAKIVLSCRSGRMSTDAAQDLVAAGYTNVYNLSGGFNAWQAAGYPFTPEP